MEKYVCNLFIDHGIQYNSIHIYGYLHNAFLNKIKCCHDKIDRKGPTFTDAPYLPFVSFTQT